MYERASCPHTWGPGDGHTVCITTAAAASAPGVVCGESRPLLLLPKASAELCFYMEACTLAQERRSLVLEGVGSPCPRVCVMNEPQLCLSAQVAVQGGAKQREGERARGRGPRPAPGSAVSAGDRWLTCSGQGPHLTRGLVM